MSDINSEIKDKIVWLVDEYRTRKGIRTDIALEKVQIDELVGGIMDVIEMYEGVPVKPSAGDNESEE